MCGKNRNFSIQEQDKEVKLQIPLFSRLCVKAVTAPDSAESTEITERPGPNLRKIANNYDIPIPVPVRFSLCRYLNILHIVDRIGTMIHAGRPQEILILTFLKKRIIIDLKIRVFVLHILKHVM